MKHLVVVLMAASSLLAQSSGWTGAVTSGGKPVPGATVTVRSGGQAQSTVTDENGRFAFDSLPDGPFAASVQMFGFQNLAQEISDRSKPAELSLQLRPLQAVRRAPGQQPQQQPQPQQQQPDEVAAAMAGPVVDAGAGESTDSFLVQGSLSRGLATEAGTPAISDAMMMARMQGAFGPGFGDGMGPGGGFGPGGGGFGAEGGVPGGGGGPGGGRGPGGPPGGGGFGGPPGGFGGPGGPGGRGPGGRSSSGRPGKGDRESGRGKPGKADPAGRPDFANMTPQQREELRRRFAERMRQGALTEGFGNRGGRRTRQQIRGQAFWNPRTSAFDATPFSVNGQVVTKPQYFQNRFGVSLGGPIGLGKILPSDKTFFFVNYQGNRGNNPFTNFAVLPDAALRAGDFSSASPIFDPLSGGKVPFPGNVIPRDRIDPIALKLLELLPSPNAAGVRQNYKIVTTQPSNSDNISVRLNRSLDAKNRLAYSVGYQRRHSEQVQLFGYRDATDGSGMNHDLTFTHNFSPRLIMNARARYNRNVTDSLPFFAYGTDISGQLGIQGNSRAPVNFGPPNLNFTNYGDLMDGNRTLRRIQTMAVSDGITFVRGAHSMTTGFEVSRLGWNNVIEQNARGTLFFGGLSTAALDATGKVVANTGNDFADFLLGRPQQSTLRFGSADAYMRQTSFTGFFQDEWRARPNLTFNLGLRYEDWEPFSEKYGRLANLVLNADRTAVTLVTGNDIIKPDRNNLSPRLAFSWRPKTKTRTVVRGGYSMFYDGSVYSRIPQRLGWQPPFAINSQFATTTDSVLTLATPFLGRPDVTIRNTFAVNPNYPAPRAQTWNFALQNEFWRGWVIETGYLGTKGTGLLVQRLPNRALPGSAANAEQRRIIPNAVGFTFDNPEGSSIFHAGQVRLTRRMSRGLSLNAMYQWSKSLDNASTIGGTGAITIQDENNLAAERGRSNFDRRHTVTISSMLFSPFGERGYFLKKKNAVATALRNWTLTTNITANSGSPFTARVLGAAADAGGTGATGSARASATGLPLYTGDGYFNTAAFTVPAAGQFGSAGRNTIDGPGQFMLNASFGRSFSFAGDPRHGFEFRVSAENALNRVNIVGIGTVVNSANYGLATNAGDMRSVQVNLRFRF